MFFKKKTKQIDVNELDEIENLSIIDIRSEKEFKMLPTKNTQNIEVELLLEDPAKYLDEDKEYCLLCHSGMRSNQACSLLEKQGYNVVNLTGGLAKYQGNKLK